MEFRCVIINSLKNSDIELVNREEKNSSTITRYQFFLEKYMGCFVKISDSNTTKIHLVRKMHLNWSYLSDASSQSLCFVSYVTFTFTSKISKERKKVGKDTIKKYMMLKKIQVCHGTIKFPFKFPQFFSDFFKLNLKLN